MIFICTAHIRRNWGRRGIIVNDHFCKKLSICIGAYREFLSLSPMNVDVRPVGSTGPYNQGRANLITLEALVLAKHFT